MAACQTLLAEQVRAITAAKLTITTFELAIASLNDRLEQQQQEIAEQKLTINELLRRGFEKRSERYLKNPDQLRLDFGNTAEAASATEGLTEAFEQAASALAEIVVSEHTRRQHTPRKPRNEQLPAHLPRYEVTAAVSPEVQTCATHGEKKLIGHDRLETLEFERPKLKFRVTLIPKFTCVKSPECGVTEAARPEERLKGNAIDRATTADLQALRLLLAQPRGEFRHQD